MLVYMSESHASTKHMQCMGPTLNGHLPMLLECSDGIKVHHRIIFDSYHLNFLIKHCGHFRFCVVPMFWEN